MNQVFRSKFLLFLVTAAISATDLASAGEPAPQLDDKFRQLFDRDIRCLAVQQDGKILAGGDFEIVSTWASYAYLVRLDSVSGEIDHSFRVDANGSVTHVAIRNDGYIVIAGSFTQIGGSGAGGLAILKPDGNFHANFNYPLTGAITALAIKPDGKILIAGGPDSQQGSDHWVIQTSASGMFEPSFGIINVDGPVSAIAAKPDGKILFGGEFTIFANNPRNNLAQITPTGGIDPAFAASTNSKVSCLSVQADGKILLAGNFTQVGNLSRNGLGRIDSTGAPDSSFQSQINLTGPVKSLALQANGNIAIGGSCEEKAALLAACRT